MPIFYSGILYRKLCRKLCRRFNIIKTKTFYDIQCVHRQSRVKPVNNHLFFTRHCLRIVFRVARCLKGFNDSSITMNVTKSFQFYLLMKTSRAILVMILFKFASSSGFMPPVDCRTIFRYGVLSRLLPITQLGCALIHNGIC